MPASAPTLIQDLTLEVGTTSYECQLSNASVVPSYSDNAVQTWCGEFTTTRETHQLHIEGFQDYGAVDALCDLLWAAELDSLITFTLTVAGATWSGSCSPRKPNAGGSAGGPLDFTIDLPVQGELTYTPATP